MDNFSKRNSVKYLLLCSANTQRAELNYREKLIHGTETLNRASESVARSQRVAAETGWLHMIIN